MKVNDKNNASSIVGEGKLEQAIKSLNDIEPPSLRSSITPLHLSFGAQEVKVSLTEPFYFPGIKRNLLPVPVQQYEWKIPKEWKAKAGTATPSGTYITSDAYIQLITDASSGGEVMVRGVNDCFNSGDYSVYSYPLIFTRNATITLIDYPQTVPFGNVDTCKFSVMSLAGISFEWDAPREWSINGGGNTYIGSNIVHIITSKCPTNEKVRVRMVKDGEASAWTKFPTTVELPTIKVPTGQMTQYQKPTFSLNMANTDIASVEWFVNDKSVGLTNDSSSFSFLFVESGNVKVSAKLTMKGCQSVSIKGVDVNVVKAPDPAISGPSSICNEASYTIRNLPPGATVQWSVDNNLRIIRGQGSSTIVVRRSFLGHSLNCKISAEILVSGNKFTIYKSNIQVGSFTPTVLLAPFTSGPPVTNLDYGVTGKRYLLYPSGVNLSRNDSDYKWKFYSHHPFELPTQGVGRQIEYIQYSPGNYTVSLQYNGECGWTNELFSTIRIEGPEVYFYLFPNPSTDIVNVKFRNEATDNQMFANEAVSEAPLSDIIEIQLWNSSSLVKTYKTDQESYQFSVSDLPKGIYFIHVIKDGKTYTEKLIKN